MEKDEYIEQPSKRGKFTKKSKESCKFTINSLLSKSDRPHKTPAPHLDDRIVNKKAHNVFSFSDSPEKIVKIKSPHLLTAEVKKLYTPTSSDPYNVSCDTRQEKTCSVLKCNSSIYRPTTAQLLYQRQLNRREDKYEETPPDPYKFTALSPDKKLDPDQLRRLTKHDSKNSLKIFRITTPLKLDLNPLLLQSNHFSKRGPESERAIKSEGDSHEHRKTISQITTQELQKCDGKKRKLSESRTQNNEGSCSTSSLPIAQTFKLTSKIENNVPHTSPVSNSPVKSPQICKKERTFSSPVKSNPPLPVLTKHVQRVVPNKKEPNAYYTEVKPDSVSVNKRKETKQDPITPTKLKGLKQDPITSNKHVKKNKTFDIKQDPDALEKHESFKPTSDMLNKNTEVTQIADTQNIDTEIKQCSSTPVKLKKETTVDEKQAACRKTIKPQTVAFLTDPSLYVKVLRCPEGRSTHVELNMKIFEQLHIHQQHLVIDYFFELVFGESDNQFADNVMGIVRHGARHLPNVLEYLVENHPNMGIKHQILGKKDIANCSVKEYYEKIKLNHTTYTFTEGGLLQTSLVGVKSEESGGFFGELLDLMSLNPFYEASLPWGVLSHYEGLDPDLSNDGPIFWIRPGEQYYPATSGSRNHKGYRLLKNRETFVKDRTTPHMDHSWEGDKVLITVAAAAYLQPVKAPSDTSHKNFPLKDVIAFQASDCHKLIEELQIDVYEPPTTQCDIWINDAKMNQLRSQGIRYSRIKLFPHDMYFIPRNVVHQFKTVAACQSIAWHVRLKHYYKN